MFRAGREDSKSAIPAGANNGDRSSNGGIPIYAGKEHVREYLESVNKAKKVCLAWAYPWESNAG